MVQEGHIPSKVSIERNVAYSEESSFDERRVPRRSAPSFMSAKNTGTRISTWMVEVIMPPTIGAAIGFITSEPIPDSQRIGIRLARTAVTVISLGRKRWTAPSMVAA